MGKYTVLKCDLCGQEVESNKDFFRIKAQSSSFVNYANYDMLFSDRKRIDLCKDCVNKFLKFALNKDLDSFL